MNDILNFAALTMFLVAGLWAGIRARPWKRLLLVLCAVLVLTQLWGMRFERDMWQRRFEELSRRTGMSPEVVNDLDPWSEVEVSRTDGQVIVPRIGRYRWTMRTFTVPHIAALAWMTVAYASGRIGRRFLLQRDLNSLSVDSKPG
jgi:hypothetical protein